MLNSWIGPSPCHPKIARIATLMRPARGPSRNVHARPSTTVGTSSGNSTQVNTVVRSGKLVRSTSQASAKATKNVKDTEPATKIAVDGMMFE